MRHWYLSLFMGRVWSSRPDATHTEWQIPVSHTYSEFLLMMGTCMPKHVEEKWINVFKQKCARSWIIFVRDVQNPTATSDAKNRITVIMYLWQQRMDCPTRLYGVALTSVTGKTGTRRSGWGDEPPPLRVPTRDTSRKFLVSTTNCLWGPRWLSG